jgi:MFS family permease
MKQVNKFYLASFLKNQTYFVPILVIFFQDLGLSFTQIFWIFTIGSAFSFLIEIPTGVIADMYGNRISIIWSKLLIFVSFILFALSGSFIALLLANLVYELGKSFRSGTETAFIYNYLDQDKSAPRYTVVKVNQKFYARISESAAALLGGFVAAKLGFSIVFYLAAIPAFINFIQTLTWERLKTDKGKVKAEFKLIKQWLFIKQAFQELKTKKIAIKVIFNIALFSAGLAALDKFIQPYMKNTGIELEYFGLIYSIFLILVALLVKFASRLEDRLGADKIMNYSSFISLIALAILTFFSNSILSVGLYLCFDKD